MKVGRDRSDQKEGGTTESVLLLPVRVMHVLAVCEQISVAAVYSKPKRKVC